MVVAHPLRAVLIALALFSVAALFRPVRHPDLGALAAADYDLRLRIGEPSALLRALARNDGLRALLEANDRDDSWSLGLGTAESTTARSLSTELLRLLGGEGSIARAIKEAREIAVYASRRQESAATSDGRLYGEEDRRGPFPFARFLVAIRIDKAILARLASFVDRDFLLRRFADPKAPRDWGLRTRRGIVVLADPERAFGPTDRDTRGIPSLAIAVADDILLCGLPDDVAAAREKLAAAPAQPESANRPNFTASFRPEFAAGVESTARVLFGDLAVDTVEGAFAPTSAVDLEVIETEIAGTFSWRIRCATSAAMPGADAPDAGSPQGALGRIAFGRGAVAFRDAETRAARRVDLDRDRFLTAAVDAAPDSGLGEGQASMNDDLPAPVETAAAIALAAPSPIEIGAHRRGAHRPIVAAAPPKAPRADADAFVRANFDGKAIAAWLRLSKDSIVADRFRPTVSDLARFATRDDLDLFFVAEERARSAAYAASVEIWAALFEKLAPRVEIVARRAAQGIVIEPDQK